MCFSTLLGTKMSTFTPSLRALLGGADGVLASGHQMWSTRVILIRVLKHLLSHISCATVLTTLILSPSQLEAIRYLIMCAYHSSVSWHQITYAHIKCTPGQALNLTPFGTISDPFWDRFGPFLGRFWTPFGSILALLVTQVPTGLGTR